MCDILPCLNLKVVLIFKCKSNVSRYKHRGCGTLALHTEGWVFESQLRQTRVVKTGSDSSTVKHSVTGTSVTSSLRDDQINGCLMSK